jgi:hypothetical protein
MAREVMQMPERGVRSGRQAEVVAAKGKVSRALLRFAEWYGSITGCRISGEGIEDCRSPGHFAGLLRRGSPRRNLA